MSAPALNNIFLTGMMGSGKSVVGRILAEKLAYRFIDSDSEIERSAGTKVSGIFAEKGEAAFRDLEEATILRLCRESRQVLALGGGALGRPCTRSAIQASGKLVYLRASPATLARRLESASENAKRPVLQGAQTLQEIEAILVKLLATREPDYSQADFTLDTDQLNAEQAAHQLLQSLGAPR